MDPTVFGSATLLPTVTLESFQNVVRRLRYLMTQSLEVHLLKRCVLVFQIICDDKDDSLMPFLLSRYLMMLSGFSGEFF